MIVVPMFHAFPQRTERYRAYAACCSFQQMSSHSATTGNGGTAKASHASSSVLSSAIALASLILKDISDVHLKKVIGGIACLFAVLESLRPYWQPLLGNSAEPSSTALQFKTVARTSCGDVCGAFSTLAHMGGLVVVMYLLPQRLSNTAFVANNNRHLFSLNFIKIPFYYQLDLFSFEILIEAVALLPFIGLGVLTGIALNNRVPERLFSRIVLFFLFATGLHLLFS